MEAAVTSTGAPLLLLPKPSLSSTSRPPLFFTRRPPPVLRFPSLRLVPSISAGSSRFTPVQCCVNRSGDSSSPLNSVFKLGDPPGFHDKSWIVLMDKPGGEGATEQQMVDCYIQTLAQVVGSEDEALKKIYRVLSEPKLGFGCVIDDEETLDKLRGLPGVSCVLPDPYVPDYKDPADTLKHYALNIKRWIDHECKDGMKYRGWTAPRFYNSFSDKLMDDVEEHIQALSTAYKGLDLSEVYSKLQTRVEPVLSDLSVQVKQLGSIKGTTEGAEKERAMVLEQVKKAIESLSLALEAVDSLHSDLSYLISLMAQIPSKLSSDGTGGPHHPRRRCLKVDDDCNNPVRFVDLETFRMDPEDFKAWQKKTFIYVSKPTGRELNPPHSPTPSFTS